VSFQFGSGDYIRDTGRSHIGEGVLPDEDILPKQSDLVAGRDTVVERALEWLRQ
jgi:C-terminal processing protease CtpA/Prc